MHAALGHYRALHNAARRQAEALDAGEFDRFLAILDEREALLALIDTAGLPSEQRERQETETLARAILQTDEANATRLRQALEAAQQELGALRGGQRLMQSYRSSAERPARFIDHSG
ncbi:MAG: flagellar protein FliT [Chloroflexi bacterium]|nr:flagellar protein FliT [Chloroflexota bacterium]